ncbi:MAG: ABC transporter ATP-binding protein, partial [Candidatus Tectomicrobia bacterium]
LHLIRVTKSYPAGRHSVPALDNASLWIRRGETMSVVGPTGCGKSSLLRVIAGLDLPDSGIVTFDGEEVDHLPPGKRGIGLVFQTYALYPHFKVRGNIAFYFRLRRWSDTDIDAKVEETSRVMGIGFDKLLGRMPRSLSGGEKQRVALARCLSHTPRVLLLDEPFSNLDASLRLQTRSEVKRLVDRFGLTTVFVTHDQSEAVAMGHRLAVMQAGCIEQVGTYQELYRKPANTFVAGFLGSPPMNFFPARRHHNDIQLEVDSASLPIPLTTYLQQRVEPDAPFTVGLRPEHFHLTAPDAPGALPGTVVMVEMSMSDATQVLYVQHGQCTWCAKTDLRQPVQTGQTVWLQFSAPDLYYFDHSGNSL